MAGATGRELLMGEHIVEAGAAQKNVALLVYVLQGLGFFTGGLTFIAALIVNYLKASEVRDSWLESHFRWQINTFWYGLLWWVIAMLFWLVLMGWLASAIVTVWMVYRIIKGALYLNDSKPIIF
tara:strand:+ start:1872 stop:2243 length:372 start_codon:yes stop_codon:yes gene_type:complete